MHEAKSAQTMVCKTLIAIRMAVWATMRGMACGAKPPGGFCRYPSGPAELMGQRGDRAAHAFRIRVAAVQTRTESTGRRMDNGSVGPRPKRTTRSGRTSPRSTAAAPSKSVLRVAWGVPRDPGIGHPIRTHRAPLGAGPTKVWAWVTAFGCYAGVRSRASCARRLAKIPRKSVTLASIFSKAYSPS